MRRHKEFSQYTVPYDARVELKFEDIGLEVKSSATRSGGGGGAAGAPAEDDVYSVGYEDDGGGRQPVFSDPTDRMPPPPLSGGVLRDKPFAGEQQQHGRQSDPSPEREDDNGRGKRRGGTRLRVLSGVGGVCKPGRIVAVMGPSGSGKSSLLSILSGAQAATEGALRLNGAEMDRAALSSLMEGVSGFVPQGDVLRMSLTVAETLLHAAATRLPPSGARKLARAAASAALAETTSMGGGTAAVNTVAPTALELSVRRSAEDVARLVNLEHVAGTRAGDLSGGEKRRLSVAIELCARPSILFLDEPTTGLDSASTRELVGALRRVATGGTAVVAVIHQPSREVFRAIDDVVLLAAGGLGLYAGSTAGLAPWLADAARCPCPPRVNVADHALDVVSDRAKVAAIAGGVPGTISAGEGLGHSADKAIFGDMFADVQVVGGGGGGGGGGGNKSSNLDGSGKDGGDGATASSVTAALLAARPSPAGFGSQLWLHTRRAWQRTRADSSGLAVHFTLHLVIAGAVALAFALDTDGATPFTPPIPEAQAAWCPAAVAQYLCTIGER
jgi:ABC-type multidrug transport system ATPase subunit